MESRERQVWIQASLTWWRSFVVERKPVYLYPDSRCHDYMDRPRKARRTSLEMD